MWRSEYFSNLLYRSNNPKLKISLDENEMPFVLYIRQINKFIESIDISFTNNQKGDAKEHLKKRFEILYKLYNALRKEAKAKQQLLKRELSNWTARMDNVLNFKIYKFHTSYTIIMDFLKQFENQVNSLLRSILNHSSIMIDENEERLAARKRHIYSEIKELEDDLQVLHNDKESKVAFISKKREDLHNLDEQSDTHMLETYPVQEEVFDLYKHLSTLEDEMNRLRNEINIVKNSIDSNEVHLLSIYEKLMPIEKEKNDIYSLLTSTQKELTKIDSVTKELTESKKWWGQILDSQEE